MQPLERRRRAGLHRFDSAGGSPDCTGCKLCAIRFFPQTKEVRCDDSWKWNDALTSRFLRPQSKHGRLSFSVHAANNLIEEMHSQLVESEFMRPQINCIKRAVSNDGRVHSMSAARNANFCYSRWVLGKLQIANVRAQILSSLFSGNQRKWLWRQLKGTHL